MPRDRRQVEVALARPRARHARERGVDLLPHLVAAAARARADRARHRAVRAELAQRGDAVGEDPAGQPAPAAVQGGDRAVGGEHDGEAVGDEDERRRVGQRRGLTVLLRRGTAVARRLRRAPHRHAVHLAPVEEAPAREADERREALAVRVDVASVVVGQAPEVQRRVRPARDAAAPAGEEHARARQLGGHVPVLPAERSGKRRLGHYPTTATPRPATGEDWMIDVVVWP